MTLRQMFKMTLLTGLLAGMLIGVLAGLALSITLIAAVTQYLVHRLAIALAFLVPATVGFSRMYRGMHYPSDVVAGAALAAVWLIVSLHSVRMGAFRLEPAEDE